MREQLPMNKSLGREDNIMYKVSEGYNLNPNDKTYFDKFNIMEMLNLSHSMSTAKSMLHGNSSSVS